LHKEAAFGSQCAPAERAAMREVRTQALTLSAGLIEIFWHQAFIC
jgi:hypothetical protein